MSAKPPSNEEASQKPPRNEEATKSENMVDMGFGISIVKEKSLMINHSSFKRMTRDLMEVLFSREEMAVLSVSGRKSNINPDTAAKPALTKRKVLAIIAHVQKHFPGTDKASINTAMAYKLKDVATEEM
ncbi:BEN domain-containing protein 6-like [Anguilla anguilla]|uniref:BEN domain-containing protein 6-like n=1 Tax=Anguilla anguilla TaxID=7936 RepID=UPI0015ABE4E6|nr:BEN domain-containing protein 6-like [Anguilla anguilla]